MALPSGRSGSTAAPAPLTVAAAQLHSHGGDVAAAVAEHRELLAAAADRGAQLVVFPELSLTGYEPEIIDLHRIRVDADHPALAPLVADCTAARLHAFVGAPVSGPDGAAGLPQIGVLHIDPQGRVGHAYSKQHLTPMELGLFGTGGPAGRITIGGHRLALSVCADAADERHPAAAAHAGAEAYLVGALFLIGAESRLESQMTTAARLGLWTVLAQYCGGTGGGPACGGSGIWAPGGEPVERLAGAAGVAVATIG
ncbi:carbon-nitrogen hydrolase family protein [Nakamurella sp. YIM 132087]|uniref:Carbon-nitrogen hydrolase family protein n=1 Tax=Nakamurella alba TaxID=2665158 RepID=A0A7K1FR85_9ACTN|nr:carbon-nitrogen hydrolase family protein [Nakamurella alba]MTD16646.1 carbon-nitrogen hydrolase family protein [Nakamurella alba]